jgi:hypothetical protein
MIETSAHLIDHVLPPVPIRQWVLAFPWPLRLLLSTRPAAVTRVLAIIMAGAGAGNGWKRSLPFSLAFTHPTPACAAAH